MSRVGTLVTGMFLEDPGSLPRCYEKHFAAVRYEASNHVALAPPGISPVLAPELLRWEDPR